VTLTLGSFDESYPPEILRGAAAPALVGAARRAPTSGEEAMPDQTTPPNNPGPESNSPEGAVPVDATRTDPDGPAVVAVPAEQLDTAAAEAEPTSTVRGLTDDERTLEPPAQITEAGDEGTGGDDGAESAEPVADADEQVNADAPKKRTGKRATSSKTDDGEDEAK
jgi:hypothetical protein